jgi:hypothetical protein
MTTTIPDFLTADLTVGTTLPNGETVIALRKVADVRLCEDGDYNYATWKVVCVRGGKNFHDYATRTVTLLPIRHRPHWGVSGGDYWHDIHDALNEIGLNEMENQ